MYKEYLDDFITGYLGCALAITIDDSHADYNPDNGSGPTLEDNYGIDDINPGHAFRIRQECQSFINDNESLLNLIPADAKSAGIQFWLSRAGYGCGFCDYYNPKYPELEAAYKVLHKAAMATGERNLYVGDDQHIYQYEQ